MYTAINVILFFQLYFFAPPDKSQSGPGPVQTGNGDSASPKSLSDPTKQTDAPKNDSQVNGTDNNIIKPKVKDPGAAGGKQKKKGNESNTQKPKRETGNVPVHTDVSPEKTESRKSNVTEEGKNTSLLSITEEEKKTKTNVAENLRQKSASANDNKDSIGNVADRNEKDNEKVKDAVSQDSKGV